MVFLAAPALPAQVVTLPALAPSATVATRPATAPAGWSDYTVKGGDTLLGLAAIHRTTVEEIATRNGIEDPRRLRAGATILVPLSAAPGESSEQLAAPSPEQTPATEVAASAYTVKPGDSAWSIAHDHAVSVPALLKANGLGTTSLLQIGQVLTIPGATTAAPSSTKPAPAPVAERSTTAETSFAGMDSIPAPSGSAAANRALLATATVPSRTATHDLIVEVATQHGVDPKLALAIAMQESGWDQRHVSPVNAIGVMQVIPAAGDWAEHLLGRELNLLDTRDNVTAGVVILRGLGRLAGTEEQAIASYYQGLSSVKAEGWYPDTSFYVRSVLALKARV